MTKMKRICLLTCVFVIGCANQAAIYTEEGLRAAEKSWDGHYRSEADRCEKLHEPATPEMEACFGASFDADAKIATAVQSAVALLRTYWTARAAGEKPDFGAVVKQVKAIVDGLPPEARKYFDNVRGLAP